MTDLRKAAEQALETLEKSIDNTFSVNGKFYEAKLILRKALAQSEWIGLTENEAQQLYEHSTTEWQFAQSIEAKLKEKNGG